ncbi:hybrid sensor histidine kinase/response regulator transcription factor [Winogradskyella undariae]|uniref:hybrid sensor histidine kinase/response regulator transcription factor n=1 Tax=Winogradskyella undariae TaxID=1285465 RepID=UPI0015CA6557|nr:two-component regulator propeller domain-containing protein [Winogradskyella undariae]
MRIPQLAYLIFFLSISVGAQNDPIISLTGVSPEGGVSITSVMCINEDHLGFIWFGTNNGLFKYDSNEIKRYSYSQSNSKSLSTNRINQILSNTNGDLLIATENGICKYNPVSDDFTRLQIKTNQDSTIGNNIDALIQTSNGEYWFLDERGVAKLNTNLDKAEYISIDNNSSRARLLHMDASNNIWLVFQDGKVYYKTKDSEHFQFFAQSISGYPRSVFADNNKVWIGYDNKGLMCFDIDGTLLNHYNEQNNFISNRVRSIIKSNNGNIWVATYNGIAVLNNLDIVKVVNSENHPNLTHQSIWSLYKDSNNIIWVGSWLGGLSYHSEFKNSVTHITQSNKNRSRSNNIITAFSPDPDKVCIWIGTETGKLIKYNQHKNETKEVEVLYDNKKVKNIKSIVFDSEKQMWVGTRDDGILYRKKNEKKFTKLNVPFNIGLQITTMLPEEDGIWISDYQQGVFHYSFIDHTFKQYKHNPLDSNSISNNHIRKIIKDRKGDLWFATEKGLNLLKKDSEDFISFLHSEEDENSLSADYIYSIFEDFEGHLWIGTNGSGLDKLDVDNLKFKHYTIKNNLPGNEIYTILDDINNNIWLATDNGICKFYPNENKVLTFGHIEGIYNNSFTPNAGLFSENGLMFFGGSNGFIYFRPNDILIRNTIKPKATITNFYVSNEAVLPGQQNKILTSNINTTELIKLNHNQNSFSFRLTSNNYIDPDKNRFKYRLLNFDENWVETDINGPAIFTNVPPGDYTFEVLASNNDDIWNETPTRLQIKISNPFWTRWYAFLIYSLLTLSIIMYVKKEAKNRRKLKNQIQLEKIKNESEEQLHQLKLQFFTNITHEFRTPLTLIMGPVKRLINNYDKSDPIFNQINLIKNNSERLLRLTNQILDFRKLEAGKLKLEVSNLDIVSFTKSIFDCFTEHAKYRGFIYNFKSDIRSLKMDFDLKKLDKIIFNILSNAFKYCDDGSTVEIKIKYNAKNNIEFDNGNEFIIGNPNIENFVEISIFDTGIGISKDNLPNIFKRFYHVDSKEGHGSGIGLDLTKEYINLHNASLKVVSVEDKGTIFSIILPCEQAENYEKLDNLEIYDSNLSKKNLTEFEEKVEKSETSHQDALILIVEDNIELLNYLSHVLGDYFKISKAKNGIEALEQIHSLFPDIIISDIMMPEMDGIELCETIKKDIRISHIPIILLTALESVKNKISGLSSGADAYISKPFDDQLLITQIINLLESRKNLRESFISINEVWEAKVDQMDIDKKLILKAVQVIDSNISNINFSVETLASELGLSRTTLHRKLKSLTNQSATEFIRYERLKHAVTLLKSGNHRMSEISHAVGFNSHNYFTTSFKKQYGMTPSEFIKKNTYNN